MKKYQLIHIMQWIHNILHGHQVVRLLQGSLGEKMKSGYSIILEYKIEVE